jgi:hypothetical protein
MRVRGSNINIMANGKSGGKNVCSTRAHKKAIARGACAFNCSLLANYVFSTL